MQVSLCVYTCAHVCAHACMYMCKHVKDIQCPALPFFALFPKTVSLTEPNTGLVASLSNPLVSTTLGARVTGTQAAMPVSFQGFWGQNPGPHVWQQAC